MRALRTIALVAFCRVAWAAPSPPRDPDAEALRDLDLLFGTDGPIDSSGSNGLARDPAQRAERFRRFVRSRLLQDAFYTTTLRRLFLMLGGLRQPLLSPYLVLAHEERGGKTIYHLPSLAPACDARDAVEVAPWWDLAHPVLVCKNSYRPEIKEELRARGDSWPRYCDHALPYPNTSCRCGEHLVNCTRDFAQRDEFSRAVDDEPYRTIQHIVQTDRPFSEVLTRNETVRNDLAEYYYARNRFLRTGKLDLPQTLDRTPRLRPRDAEFQGGLLTAPGLLYSSDAPRANAAEVWEDFLCLPLTSGRVETKAVFGPQAHVSRLRYEPNLELADRVGCRDCHAMLENSALVWRGFTSFWFGERAQPEVVAGRRTRFFGHGPDDVRGEGPATFAWLGPMIVAQPEFPRCMVHKVEELIYGGLPVDPAVDRALLAHFANDQSFAHLVEDAVVSRYVGASGSVPTTKSTFAATLAHHCGSCHDGQKQPVLAVNRDRNVALRSALSVAAKTMPPSEISDEERRTLVWGLCGLGAKDVAGCRALLAPEASLARPPRALLRALDRAVHPSHATPVGDPFLELADRFAGIRIYRDGPTLQLYRVLSASDRCGTDRSSPNCMRALLDQRLVLLPTEEKSAH